MVLTQLLVAGLLAAVSAKFVFPENIEETDRMRWTDFNSFAKKYDRQYSSGEEMFKRFQIYKDNMEHAKKMQDNEMGTATYGETQFSDMTPEEFKQTMHPYTWPKQTNSHRIDIENFGVPIEIPKSVDWRQKGAVTGVKDQKQCGSCWAFSVVANIEGAWAIAKGKLISLSEQEVVDCDMMDDGCYGGLPINTYPEIINKIGGLEKEEDYPYNAVQGNCAANKDKFVVYINDSVLLPSNEVKMAAWVASKGPLSVGLNAYALQSYHGGILHPWAYACEAGGVDHAVLIVGYGSEKGVPYWIIKNSWGPDFGENGYFRLYRGTNVCGINALPSSAIVN